MKKIEFSKVIMFSMIVAYFIGLFFGLHIIEKIIVQGWDATSALCALFSYIGAPTSVAIGFYSSKAKAENLVKIGNSTALMHGEEISNRDDFGEDYSYE